MDYGDPFASWLAGISRVIRMTIDVIGRLKGKDLRV